jgi:hypothetical protein
MGKSLDWKIAPAVRKKAKNEGLIMIYPHWKTAPAVLTRVKNYELPSLKDCPCCVEEG